MMKSVLTFDLAMIDNILHRPVVKVSNSFPGFILKVSISPEELAAIRARFERGIDGVVWARRALGSDVDHEFRSLDTVATV